MDRMAKKDDSSKPEGKQPRIGGGKGKYRRSHKAPKEPKIKGVKGRRKKRW